MTTARPIDLLALSLLLCFIGCDDNRPPIGPATDAGGDAGTTATDGGTVEEPELCDGFDDDGDGEVDEACPCDPGATQDCFFAERELAGIGACVFGTQACQADGEFPSWGACEGAGSPSPELPRSGIDEDCDGEGEGCRADSLGDPWARGSPTHGWSASLAVDVDGNVLVLRHRRAGSDGGELAKLSPGGEELWARDIPSMWHGALGFGYWGRSSHIGSDDAGNVYISAHFSGTVDLGDGEMSAGGSYDSYVASFTPDGALRWSRQLGAGTPVLSVFGYGGSTAIGVDPEGNVTVAGHFARPVDFGGGTLDPLDGVSTFALSLSSEGSHRWSRVIASSVHVGGWYGGRTGVTADRLGNVTIVSHFTGSATLGGRELVAEGYYDGLVASFGPDGSDRWAHVLHSEDPTASTAWWSGREVATDERGNVYLAGRLWGALTIDGERLEGADSGTDAFLISFEPTGEQRWAREFTVPAAAWGDDLAVEPTGRAHFVASYLHQPGAIVSFDAAGAEIRRRELPSLNVWVGSIAAGCGSLYIGGYLNGIEATVLDLPVGEPGVSMSFVMRVGDE